MVRELLIHSSENNDKATKERQKHCSLEAAPMQRKVMKNNVTTKQSEKKNLSHEIFEYAKRKKQHPPTERPIQQLVYFIFP